MCCEDHKYCRHINAYANGNLRHDILACCFLFFCCRTNDWPDDNAATGTVSITMSLFKRIDVFVTFFSIYLRTARMCLVCRTGIGLTLFLWLSLSVRFQSHLCFVHAGWKWKILNKELAWIPIQIYGLFCMSTLWLNFLIKVFIENYCQIYQDIHSFSAQKVGRR